MNDTLADPIHQASLDLLMSPGVKMEHEKVVRLLLQNGAKPGYANDVVRIPREMVAEHLKLCPAAVELTGRKGQKAQLSASGAPAFWSCPGMNLYRNGSCRHFRSSDMADAARLLDQLDNVQGVFGMGMEDVSPGARDVAGLAIMAQNTSKHIRVFCFTPAGGRTLVEMKRVVGNHPWFSMGFTAHGPLRWTNLALSIFEATSGHRIPATINGEPMAGTSGPVTLAGSAAVGNAEILAGIIAVQLLEPGRPCIYNLGLAHIFDMRTMIAVTGGPENVLLAQVSAAMGRFYNLPSASWVSTESMCPDAQAAMEKTFGFHSHMASGVSNIWGVGQLESELTFSPAQAVIDDEIIAYSKRCLRGVEMNKTALAVDVVQEVGIGGNFLDHPHTADHFKTEFFMPKILLRQKRETWEAAGRKRLDEAAEEMAESLMAKPPDHGMSNDQAVELEKIKDAFVRSAL